MQRFFTGTTPQPPFPWLAATWHKLAEALTLDRLPHALLITGPGGIGETDLAFALAELVLCAAKQGPQACGRCKSCGLLAANSHPDLVIITPEEQATAIKVDAVRAVSEFVANTPQQGTYKVVLVEPAEAMNLNAANALLKNLEEPTGRTLFILVSHRPMLLLPTIRSRCSLWSLPMPEAAEAEAWLTRNQVDAACAKLARAGGSPLRALAWDAEGVFAQADKAVEVLAQFLLGRLGLAAAVKALSGYQLLWLLDQWLLWLQSSTVKASRVVPSDAAFFTFYDRLLQRKQQLLRGNNPNTQLLLEELLIQLAAEPSLVRKLTA